MSVITRAVSFFIASLFSLSVFAQDQEMVLNTSTGNIHGSLLVPDGKGKTPVVLIIAGSGPTDRNGNQQKLKNNSLKFLADSLYNRSIASLRFDKRGIGSSKDERMKLDQIIFDDFLADVKGWIDLLSTDKRFSKVIVAGHSEGALLGMLASVNNPKVGAYVSIAGAARPADEIIKEQLLAQPEEIRNLVYPRLDSLRRGDTLHNVPQFLYAMFSPTLQRYLMSWMKYNPSTEVKRLSVPALFIQGTTDIQVLPKDAEMLAVAYPKGKKVLIEDMNHILKEFPSTDRQAQVATYSNSELPLHRDLIPVIVSFIKSAR